MKLLIIYGMLICFVIGAAEYSHAFDIYVVQYGESQYIPCEGNPTTLAACFRPPKQDIYFSKDEVIKALGWHTKPTHIWKISCSIGGMMGEKALCSSSELEMFSTFDVKEKSIN